MGKQGFNSVAYLRGRTRLQRGGQAAKPLLPQQRESSPDALSRCRDAYLERLSARNYAVATRANIEQVINIFLLWAAERELSQATQITRPILEAYQLALSRSKKSRGQGKGKPLGWSTQTRVLTTLKGWFKWLTRQNILLHNPASELELPRREMRLPVAGLTLSQMETLLAIPDTRDPLGVRDRAMLEVFYSTGMRRAELTRLGLSDFNAERRTLLVRQGKGHKDRMVPLGEVAAFWLTRYLEEVRPRLLLDSREQALFLTGYGGPFNPDVLSRMMSAWLKTAGLEGKGCCHLLRHTCATHMLEGGADIRYIQQLLGHANLDTTSIYTQVAIHRLQEVHARCHPSGKLPGGSLL